MADDLTYQEYRERIDAWIRKNAQRKAGKTRRIERQRVQQAGGGKALATLMLKPARKVRK